MDLLYRILLLVHVSAGFASLSIFFVPMLAKKGGKVHTRAGWWYVWGMSVVIVTAFFLSMFMISLGRYEEGLFFAFLSLLTGRPLYYGTVIVRYKRTEVPLRVRRISLVLLVGMLALTPILLYVGIAPGSPGVSALPLVFGILGLTALPELLREIRVKVPPSEWLFDHIKGMLISSIAAFTAFFAFGGRRLFADVFTGQLEIVPWVAPTILGFLAIKWYKRKYARPGN